MKHFRKGILAVRYAPLFALCLLNEESLDRIFSIAPLLDRAGKDH